LRRATTSPFAQAARNDWIHFFRDLSTEREKETAMAENRFLTAEEVSERYRGEITVGTLRNWRAMRIGPPFAKIGKAVLYPQ
jgi:hypothetical protein